MKKLAFLLISLSMLSTCQTTSNYDETVLAEARPEDVGMSEQRLSKIDAMLKKAVETNEVPGVVALVARKGKVVLHKAYGMADTEETRELKRDDIFRIASQTKAITATAVMMLWEEGLFRLDDPISKYIPEFKGVGILDTFNEADSSFTTIPATIPITIRHLLTHTSGIGYGMIDVDHRIRKIYQKVGIIDAFTTEPVSIGDNIKKLAKLPLHHNPGENFTYSEGLDVLGYFIEILSGMPLDKFFQTRIFEPLGMEDTYFYLPESKNQRLVEVQVPSGDKWIAHTSEYYNPDYPIVGEKTFFSGGAGLSSTALDYATFLQMYLNNGELNGHRLLSRTTVQVIMANQIGEIWGDQGAYYGLAFQVIDQKGQDMGGRGSKATFSWGGYYNTQYFADPEEQVIGVLMKQTQELSRDNTGWKFKLLVGQAIDD